MKKGLFILGGVLLALSSLLVSCDGSLHNTPASYVTLEVKNFPVNGELSFVGDFGEDAWNNSGRKFTVTNGSGSYTEPSIILTGSFKFSITTPGSWVRPWYPAVSGNSDDFGKMQNILIDVPMDGGTHKIILDGASGKFDEDTIVVE